MNTDRRCARRAELGYGVLRRNDIMAAGISRDGLARRVASGRLIPMSNGIYRWPGVARSWRGELMYAYLCAAPRAAVSHRSAAALHGLQGFDPGVVEISCLRQVRRRGHCDAIVHVVRHVDDVDVTVVDRIPVTAVPRTLVDLAAVVSAERLELALDDALRRRLVSMRDVVETVDRLGTRDARASGVCGD